MPKVVVRNFAISLDGYGAGPDQSLQNPLGVNGEELHQWAFKTRTFHRMFGKEGGSTGTDEKFSEKSFENIGAWILGRNMFGLSAAPGRMITGRAGGAMSRPITFRFSC